MSCRNSRSGLRSLFLRPRCRPRPMPRHPRMKLCKRQLRNALLHSGPPLRRGRLRNARLRLGRLHRGQPCNVQFRKGSPQRAVSQGATQRTRVATPSNAANRSAATSNASNTSVGSRATTNSGRNTADSTTRAATFNTRLNSTVKANTVRETLNSRSVAGVLRNQSALRNPNTRAACRKRGDGGME